MKCTLDPGVAYLVEAAQPGDDAALINVFSGDAEHPFNDSMPCRSYDYPARCVNTSAAGSLFVQAIGYLRGQPFEMRWRRAATGSEGTESAPIALALADFPYAGQVSGAGPSFYVISDLAPGTEYTVRVAPVEEMLNVNLYTGAGFENVQGVGSVFPGEPWVRLFTPTDTNGSLQIALPIGADGIGTFEVDVSPQE
jgi:hypothetical protein